MSEEEFEFNSESEAALRRIEEASERIFSSESVVEEPRNLMFGISTPDGRGGEEHFGIYSNGMVGISTGMVGIGSGPANEFFANPEAIEFEIQERNEKIKAEEAVAEAKRIAKFKEPYNRFSKIRNN